MSLTVNLLTVNLLTVNLLTVDMLTVWQLVVESKRNIDRDVALADGFVKISDVKFVKKNQDTALNARTN
jgi:hypothetical protein